LAHYVIANILDDYGLKGTFYVNTSDFFIYSLVDNYKSIHNSGHEIGNHGFNHLALTQINEEEILNEINTDWLDSTFNYKCTSFAHPYHQSTPNINHILYNNDLFTRNFSEYYTSIRPRFEIDSEDTVTDFSMFIDVQIANNSCCIICGHGIDNMGYSPCTREFFIGMLEYIKTVQKDKNVWVTTLSEGALYESLFYEVKITNNVVNRKNQIKIQFECPVKPIYDKFDKLLFSFKLEKSPLWSIPGGGAEFIESDTHYIFTIDLKQTKELTLQYGFTK